jgi:hypothetical protein
MAEYLKKLHFSDIRNAGNRVFWAWIAYQTIKGTLTTSLIWIPLIFAWMN